MRKPSGRLPVDRAKDRPEKPQHEDFHQGAQHVLAPMDLTADTRAAALRYMQRKAPDLIEALGLEGAGREARQPMDVACPTCRQPAGTRCKSAEGKDKGFHRPRVRITAEKESLTDG